MLINREIRKYLRNVQFYNYSKSSQKIFTDLAVIDITDKGLVLKEIAPNFTADEIQKVTGAHLHIDPELKEVEF